MAECWRAACSFTGRMMKMMLVFLFLLHVSQHPLALVVEVYKGENAAQLPCLYSGFMPEENPTVMWIRSDLNPKYVHLLREGGEDLRGQNQRYSGRTSMRPDALVTGDFSLTLKKPQLTDSSDYTCSITDGRQERRLRDIQLQVKDQQVEVKVEEGSESVILPCKATPGLPEGTRVEWTYTDILVHVYPKKTHHTEKQDGLYRNRTKISEDLLRTGDLSLTLKYPTERDNGGYICTIYRDKDILRQKVVLKVKESFPFWAKTLLFLLVLLVVSGGLIFYFRHNLVSVWPVKVEVEEGEESVKFPFRTTKNIPGEIQVLWERYEPFENVHVYQKGSDQPDKQNEAYRGRTSLNKDLLQTGDFSLTLMYPTVRDSGEYKCLIWRRGVFIRAKTVKLTVRVCSVEVEEGEESVKLPFRTTKNIPDDIQVLWERYEPFENVHVYQKGSDQPEKQSEAYRGRTSLNEDLLKTGDFSLTLMYPTVRDSGEYKCLVWRRGVFIRAKTVKLTVRESSGPGSNRDLQEQKQLH